jgi:hypothetical protein
LRRRSHRDHNDRHRVPLHRRAALAEPGRRAAFEGGSVAAHHRLLRGIGVPAGSSGGPAAARKLWDMLRQGSSNEIEGVVTNGVIDSYLLLKIDGTEAS